MVERYQSPDNVNKEAKYKRNLPSAKGLKIAEPILLVYLTYLYNLKYGMEFLPQCVVI